MVPSIIDYAYEGPTDAVVARRLIEHVGAVPGSGHGGKGKAHVLKRLQGYNAAAKHAPWFVLVDLDGPPEKTGCVVRYRDHCLPKPARRMCFRIAIRETEAWLLGDKHRFSSFFGVPQQRLRYDSEDFADPKAALLGLIRHSARRDVRVDMLPTDPDEQRVGVRYVARITDFVINATKGWRPEHASQSCRSLARCISCLRRLTLS